MGKISRKNHLCSKSTFSKPVQAFLLEPKLGFFSLFSLEFILTDRSEKFHFSKSVELVNKKVKLFLITNLVPEKTVVVHFLVEVDKKSSI